MFFYASEKKSWIKHQSNGTLEVDAVARSEDKAVKGLHVRGTYMYGMA
jgi:hypothetical protein